MAKQNTKRKDKKLTREDKEKRLAIKRENEKRKRTISAKSLKTLEKFDIANDPIAKGLMNRFDESIKKEFVEFLQERAKVIPIDSAKNKRGAYKQEGKEPISYKEMTSFRNPAFSDPGKYDPNQYNPEEIDVDTFTLMRRDYQLSMGLAFIKLPIIALPWRVECEDRKIKKTLEWALAKVWRGLVKSSLMAVDYGFASHEKVWVRNRVKISETDKEGNEEVFHNGDLIYFKKIKPHYPSSISVRFDNLQNVTDVVQEGNGLNEEVVLPIRKTFFFTNDKEYGNPFGTSRLKNAYKAWYYQNLLIQFMMQYFERRGTPSTKVTVPPGKSQDSSGAEIDNMELGLRLGTSIISSSVAVIPYMTNREGRENMWDIEFLKDEARGPMFVEALSHLEKVSLHSIFVPENLVSGEGGYGGASVQGDLFLMSEQGLIADLEESINSQLTVPFVEANYPPEKRKEAKVKLDPLDWNRKIALKEIFTEMIRNADSMIQFGAPPTVLPSLEKMAQILQVPTETFEDATGMTQKEFTDSMKKEKEAKEKNTRTKTRSQNVPQEQDRRRINPGGKRADRIRKTDPTKKK